MKPEYARHRPDSNSAEIAEAMRAVGAYVYHLGRPFDFLVYYRKWFVIDAKSPGGKLTPAQEKFVSECEGPVGIVYSAREALIEIGAINASTGEAIRRRNDGKGRRSTIQFGKARRG